MARDPGYDEDADLYLQPDVAHYDKMFVEAYLQNGGNATQACIALGSSPSAARSRGSNTLKHPAVAAEIKRRYLALSSKMELTTERTLLEIARLAYADPRKLFAADGNLKPIHELGDDEAACVSSLEVEEITLLGAAVGKVKKIKTWDKNAALDKAMKYHGLYEKDNQRTLLLALRELTDDQLQARFAELQAQLVDNQTP